MSIKYVGRLVSNKIPCRSFEITSESRKFSITVTGYRYELEISENGNILCKSQYIPPRFIIGVGEVVFKDANEVVVCRLKKTGFLQLRTTLEVGSRNYKLPWSNSFESEDLGFKVHTLFGSLEAEMADESNFLLGLILSSFLFLSQKRMEDTG